MRVDVTVEDLPPLPPKLSPRARPWLRIVLIGSIVLFLVGDLGLLHLRRPTASPTTAYRILSTVNYGTLSVDGHPTPWLTTPISLTAGTHVLTLVAPPLAIACIVSIPTAGANDTCPPSTTPQTLSVAPRVVDLGADDRLRLEDSLRGTTIIPVPVPKGSLMRTRMWDLLQVTPAPAGFTGDMFGAMPDYRMNIQYNVPGESDELALRNDLGQFRAYTCTTYPICDAAPRLPDPQQPPAFWISIPWLVGYDFTSSQVYRDVDYGLRRIEVPMRVTASLDAGQPTRQWVLDPALARTLINTQLCDFERASFVTYIQQHYRQTLTLSSASGCQATINQNGGRLVITNGVVFLDPLAHQDYPEFPTFAQQMQGGA